MSGQHFVRILMVQGLPRANEAAKNEGYRNLCPIASNVALER